MTLNKVVWLGTLAIAAVGPLSAVAQTAPAPPAPAERPADPILSPMMRASANAPSPLLPTPVSPDPVRLGGFHPKPPAPGGTFLREGAWIFDRQAQFSIDADGKAVLQFEPDRKAPKDAKPPPPVYVLPNLKRMAIEDAIKGRTLPLIVSGTATEFEGHNYLLLDDSTRPAGPPVAAAEPPAPATAPVPAARDQSADQLLGQLLRAAPGAAAVRAAPLRWDQAPAADATSGRGAVKPGAASVTLIREGRYLPDRLGRLSRAADGKTAEFTFDADGKALRDPPLIIMPCAKLATMQGTVLGAAKDLRFRLSGTVAEYRGRNYILPEKVVSVADASLSL